MTLHAVKHAAQKRAHWQARYADAIRTARAAGHTLQAIADQAGTSKQAVRQLLKRQAPEGGTEQ